MDKSIKLPGGEIGHYRVYKDAGAAAWITKLSLEYFDRMMTEPTPPPNPARFAGSLFGKPEPAASSELPRTTTTKNQHYA